jgi:UDP-2,3-diacylglucosamine pyrophosphatase LpxH
MLTIDQLLKTAKSKLKIYRNMRLVADRQIAESLTIFIPDMHLLEKGATDDFFHGKQENEDRFLGLLDFLLALKKKEGEKLQIVQLGDLMDVWQAKWNANGIVAAYPSIIGLIEKIRSVYVVGNHDIDLWRWYQEQGETFGRVWRHHIAVAGKIRAVVEHGFQADFFNNQAQWSGVMGKEVAKIVGMMEYCEGLQFCLNNPLHSDVVFEVGTEPVKYHAHKAILAARSPYLKTLLQKEVLLSFKYIRIFFCTRSCY